MIFSAESARVFEHEKQFPTREIHPQIEIIKFGSTNNVKCVIFTTLLKVVKRKKYLTTECTNLKLFDFAPAQLVCSCPRPCVALRHPAVLQS
jgi:hypothetical protein